MVFTSVDFLLFLALVFPLHWLVFSRGRRAQNLFLLAASYFFYGYWDYRFLALMIATTTADFLFAQRIGKTKGAVRKRWLLASIVSNFAVLGFFKYYNFFIGSLPFGSSFPTWNILLPVGISFYTFQAVSYTIDVYRETIPPARNLVEFLSFVSFFPQLVAGPIERAPDLMTQFQSRRQLLPEDVSEGVRYMLWGFFKKLVVADNCGFLVDRIFADSALRGPTLWLGLLFFSFQIYADFSAYSDIAVGAARLFGIRLSQNFRYPYFSSGVREFWQRWHISLSTWFRDYLYLPLGGNRAWMARNIMITFLISGLWHGANWTFVAWGGLHGIAYLLSAHKPHRPWQISDLPSQLFTFILISWLWVFFRAPSIEYALSYTVNAFAPNQGAASLWDGEVLLCALAGISILLAIEGLSLNKAHPCDCLRSWPTLWRHLIYLAGLCSIYLLGNLQAGYDFIYFQF